MALPLNRQQQNVQQHAANEELGHMGAFVNDISKASVPIQHSSAGKEYIAACPGLLDFKGIVQKNQFYQWDSCWPEGIFGRSKYFLWVKNWIQLLEIYHI